MAKPKSGRNVNVVFSDELVARVDRYSRRMVARVPGATMTRSDAVRELVLRALAAVERDR